MKKVLEHFGMQQYKSNSIPFFFFIGNRQNFIKKECSVHKV